MAINHSTDLQSDADLKVPEPGDGEVRRLRGRVTFSAVDPDPDVGLCKTGKTN
jgi:hypothetical protein